MKQFDLSNFILQDLKANNIDETDLQELYKITNSYENLFSKKSTQIKARNLRLSDLTEIDYKSLILDHYSFLKRPVFVADNEVFIGNSKVNIEKLKEYFNS